MAGGWGKGAKAEIARWAAAAFHFPNLDGNPPRVPRPCVFALSLRAGRRRALSLLVCTFYLPHIPFGPGGVCIYTCSFVRTAVLKE